MSRKPIKIAPEFIEEAINKSSSMKAASEYLDVTYSSFIRYAKKFGLYCPNQGLKGSSKPKTSNFSKKLILKDILENKQACKSTKLKLLLYAANLKNHSVKNVE